jgi:hypothetical protein
VKAPIYMSLKESTVIPNMLLINIRQLGENWPNMSKA